MDFRSKNITIGTMHQSILLEIVEIILDSMPHFGAVAACFQSC